MARSDLEQGDNILIERVANGYIFRPFRWAGSPREVSGEDIRLFKTPEEVAAWMRERWAHSELSDVHF